MGSPTAHSQPTAGRGARLTRAWGAAPAADRPPAPASPGDHCGRGRVVGVGVGLVECGDRGQGQQPPFSKHSTRKSGFPNAQCSMLQCPALQRVQAPSAFAHFASQHWQCVTVSSPSSLDSVCLLLFSRSLPASPAQGTGHPRKICVGWRWLPAFSRTRPYSSRQVPDLGQVVGNPRPVSAYAPSRREGTEIWKLPRGEDCRVSLAHLPMSPGTELRRRVRAVQ